MVPSMPLGWQSYDISIASFVDPTSNGLSRVFRTFLPSLLKMIAHDRWFNHFRLITTPMISEFTTDPQQCFCSDLLLTKLYGRKIASTTFRRRVMSVSISTVLVLNFSGGKGGACAPPGTTMPLTKPSLLSRRYRK